MKGRSDISRYEDEGEGKAPVVTPSANQRAGYTTSSSETGWQEIPTSQNTPYDNCQCQQSKECSDP